MVVYVQCKCPTRQDLPVADMRVKREEEELGPRRPSEEGVENWWLFYRAAHF